MKLTLSSTAKHRSRQSGMAAILMLALLGMVLAFVFANMRVLSDLHGELKIIEQNQIRRLNHPVTNGEPAPPAIPPLNSPAAQTINTPGQ
jgi:hypothetical protein